MSHMNWTCCLLVRYENPTLYNTWTIVFTARLFTGLFCGCIGLFCDCIGILGGLVCCHIEFFRGRLFTGLFVWKETSKKPLVIFYWLCTSISCALDIINLSKDTHTCLKRDLYMYQKRPIRNPSWHSTDFYQHFSSLRYHKYVQRDRYTYEKKIVEKYIDSQYTDSRSYLRYATCGHAKWSLPTCMKRDL